MDNWDLTYIYKDENKWQHDLEKLKELTDKIIKFKGHIMDNGETLLDFYKAYEALNRLSEKVFMYAHLLCDSDTKNTKYQKMKSTIDKLMEEISDKTSFISSEMLDADYDTVLKYIEENKGLEEYRFDLEKTFRYKKHTLTEQEEAIITKACNAFGTGDDVFYNLDNADIDLGTIKDEEGKDVKLTNSNYTKFMSSKNEEVRKSAFNTLYNYFEKHKNTITACYKGQIKEDFFISNVRKYNSPLEASLYSDNIDTEVYKNLIETIHNNMDLMYKYMALKKKLLNLDEMHMYDIYVNPSEFKEKDISFEEGKQIVFDALKPLGETYLKDLNLAFEENWIDIYPKEGKKSGAYSWGSYDTKPYVLLNYNGTIDSVSTMAHELGHSMHSYYSNKTQNYIDSNYPIFLAEIASTVNETILNDYLYKNAETDEEKIYYLLEFLELVRATIYRQVMFAEFEMLMHDKYQNNIPITEEELSSTYYDLNKLYYGDNIVNDDLIRYEWSRIPHFYTPFYVYKYATGLSSALSIATRIINGDMKTRDDYLEFLKSGGSDYPLNILKKVGVDMTSSKPIEEALSMFSEKLDELEKLINEKKHTK